MNLSGPLVLAFGGNALLLDPRNPAGQEEVARHFARAVRLLMTKDEGMILVHGNGPQVGMILLRIEATRDRIPPETLDILVAETQGSIGYLLSRSLRSEIQDREVAALLTQVLVDLHDPGFANPTKPVGPFYSREAAEELIRTAGWRMAEAPGRGWSRVVPSPRPQEIIEQHSIIDAVGHGHLIIAGGGGGIPVIRDPKGSLQGVEAVIDKDLTACKLAVATRAERLVILTDVPHVSTCFASRWERRISRMRAAEARRLLAEGEFPPGSMGPKVEAGALFAESTGRSALITNVDGLEGALKREAGTWIDP